ncbi:MAG: ferritin-like domain-containing protein [Alphaproteobacteria bacterium]
MAQWTLDDIPWERFEASKVDPEILKVVKAASLVEHNGYEYARYLEHVFADDAPFTEAAWGWAREEVQHGAALARWAKIADPSFDFAAAFGLFAAKIKLPVGQQRSVRGTRAGELVARCVVEVGTSSYYTALAAAAKEPVLHEICKRIAADELRHYKLFYTHLKAYLAHERIGPLRRALVVLGRLFESEDDELAFAYYAANHTGDGPYERKRYSAAYARRAYAFYRPGHIERAVAMTMKAVGLNPQGWLSHWLSRFAAWFMAHRVARLARAGA